MAAPTCRTWSCYLVEPEDLTDSEVAALSVAHADHPPWVRPWWEFFYLDGPPDEPPPSGDLHERSAPDDACPF